MKRKSRARALILAGLLSGCGGGPTAPPNGRATALQIPNGPQVLRLSVWRLPNMALPWIYTAVTVTRVGSEWIARASGAAAGDVELRIREVSSNPGGTRVSGTITGTAVHMPDIDPGKLLGATRVNFGTDGRSTVTGVLFPLTPGSAMGAFDGIGTGPLSATTGDGDSCSAESFSWMVVPHP